MDRRIKPAPEPGRDYATLLRMGWSADSAAEAVEIARDLYAAGDLDGALAAVESGRLLAEGGDDGYAAAALEVIGFEVALARSDTPRAIGGANALRLHPGALTAELLGQLRELVKASALRPELRQALVGVLDTIVPDERGATMQDVRSDAGGEAGDGDLPLVFPSGGAGAGVDAGDEEVPYLEPDLDLLSELGPLGVTTPGAPVPSLEDVDLGTGSEPSPASPWDSGFSVGDGESLQEIRERFIAAAAESAPDHARESCEAGWSFFLMEDYAAAALLFDQALGDPDVRIGAAEGLVRCRLNLSEPAEAVAFLERLQGLLFRDGLPESLRYWHGRAAEAVGDTRKARAAYRTVSTNSFPDVPGRLAGLP